MPSPRFLALVVLLLDFICVSAVISASPVPKAQKWESVSDPIQAQTSQVVQLATEAEAEAAKAGAHAKKVHEAATKASGSMTSVFAEVGAAKTAMERALLEEKKISTLRDRIWQQAEETALAEIPKILPDLQKKADKNAKEEAKKKAKAFETQMQNKARHESVKAAKVYTDQMKGAGKSAAEYGKLGDSLSTQSAMMQMNAGMEQGQAGSYMSVGQMDEAQKLLQQSRGDMNTALGLSAQATQMYDTSSQIASQLPAYADQAAMAAYHAQVMYDPEAQPPAPPLVLVQRLRHHQLKQP